MNIYAINKAITELEKSETTYENVSELSALYIVQERLTKNSTIISNDATERELQDILPFYKKYIEIKRNYQLGKATDDLLLDCMTAVCKEISEFIESLYNNTELFKERLKIELMIKELYKRF